MRALARGRACLPPEKRDRRRSHSRRSRGSVRKAVLQPGGRGGAGRGFVRQLQQRGLTDSYHLLTDLAIRYHINIVGGSQFEMDGETLSNTAFLFRRDGTIERQRKLHITRAAMVGRPTG